MSGCGFTYSHRAAAPWALSSRVLLLPAMPTAPGSARAHVRHLLLAWGMNGLADAAELVTSELATNAVRASRQSSRSGNDRDTFSPVISVCLYGEGRRLRIEVWDQAPGLPILREAPVDAECGRGLALIEAMTEGCWGWDLADHPWAIKCVWAEISRPSSSIRTPKRKDGI
jgi:anti-sigma regulatory factor (Ser/Thr protein kinase)